MTALRVLQLVTDDDRRGAQVFGVEVRTVALAHGRAGVLILASRDGDSEPHALMEPALVGTLEDDGRRSDHRHRHRSARKSGVSPRDAAQLTSPIGELLDDEASRAPPAASARDHALDSFSMSAVASSSWLAVLARTAGIDGPLHSADG